MLFRLTTVFLLAGFLVAGLSGCSWFSDTRTYTVYFQPYSPDLDQQAIGTIQDAAHFARIHPLKSVQVVGFAAQPDPKRDVAGLSAKRADTVKQVLVGDGVREHRIKTVADGIINPKPLPEEAARRVDINIGQDEPPEATQPDVGSGVK